MITLSEDDINIIVSKVIKILKKENGTLKKKYKENNTIRDLLNESRIIEKVADFTGISREEMFKRKRKHEHVRARYIVITELMRESGYSQGKAAAVFGFNHATALYAKAQLTGDNYQSTKYYNEYLKSTEKWIH